MTINFKLICSFSSKHFLKKIIRQVSRLFEDQMLQFKHTNELLRTPLINVTTHPLASNVYEMYRGGLKAQNDIAMLKLKKPVTFNEYIKPLALANSSSLMVL
uniref:Peptidase S1 domain-containing protein n=1 Tax=Romanomermis culicivorax TaxID=13658 RepID=A0A915HDJ2_ROMCU